MNFIKNLSFVLILTLSLTGLVLIQNTAFANEEGEYRNGYTYGQQVAKEDAIKFNGSRSSINVGFEQKKYLSDLRQTKSEKYIKGFLWGYEASFNEHIRVYYPIPFKG